MESRYREERKKASLGASSLTAGSSPETHRKSRLLSPTEIMRTVFSRSASPSPERDTVHSSPRHPPLSPPPQPVLDLTEPQRTLLIQENASLLTEYTSAELSVIQSASESISTIAELQTLLTQNIESQALTIEAVYNESVYSLDHVTRGFNYLKQLRKDPDITYKLASLFLLLAAFVLLLLDWLD